MLLLAFASGVLGLGSFAAEQPETKVAASVTKLGSHNGPATGVAITRDQSTLISAGTDGVLRLWDIGKMKETGRIRIHSSDAAIYISLLSRDNRLAVAISDGGVEMWDLNRQERMWRVKPLDDLSHIDASADGRLLAVSSADGVYLLDAKTGATLKVLGSSDPMPYCVRFAPDGKTLVVGYDVGKAIIWDVALKKPIRELRTGGANVYGACFTKDGSAVATACEDKVIRVFNSQSGKLIAEFKGHQGQPDRVIYAGKGQLLSTDTTGELIVWDVKNKTPKRRVRCASSQLVALALFKNQSKISLACEEGVIVICDLER